jgi:glycosyltransferase involved in cell wall biosynthesis
MIPEEVGNDKSEAPGSSNEDSVSGPVRLGVNLLWLVPGEVGGSEEYTVGLLRALGEQGDSRINVMLYVNRRFRNAYPDLLRTFESRVAPISGSSRIQRVLVEASWLAHRSRRDNVTFIHHTGGTMPAVRRVPGIVTLHDLQPMTHPERFGFIKRTYIRWIAPRSLRSAVAVACLTRFTAQDAIQRVGVHRNRIHIVPCGIETDVEAPDPVVQNSVLDRYGILDRRYVLYPAITYAHKNHEMLVASFARVCGDRPDTMLVLTGGSGPNEEVVQAAIDAYGLRGRVVRPGRVPESDLDVLYRNAHMLVFPSLYEGFGLPALEAMSRGCPVIASRVGGLPEVTGNAAVLLDPFDTAGWVTAMADLFDHPSRRIELSRRGRLRAAEFRWPDSARSLASLYSDTGRKLLDSSREPS